MGGEATHGQEFGTGRFHDEQVKKNDRSHYMRAVDFPLASPIWPQRHDGEREGVK
jgi:hypothetical protein